MSVMRHPYVVGVHRLYQLEIPLYHLGSLGGTEERIVFVLGDTSKKNLPVIDVQAVAFNPDGSQAGSDCCGIAARVSL